MFMLLRALWAAATSVLCAGQRGMYGGVMCSVAGSGNVNGVCAVRV